MLKRTAGVLLAAAATAAPAAATPPGTNGLIAWLREEGTGPQLWVANPDGSGARQVLVTARRPDFEASFSPTDATLLFFTGAGTTPLSQDIFGGDLATGVVTGVIARRSADVAPAVSPDGTKIAYYSVRRPKRSRGSEPAPERIRIAAVDGSGDRAITSRRRSSVDPDWSPDGRRLVYTETRFAGPRDVPRNRLVVIDADGSGRRPITAFGGLNEINGRWMPDGRSILYERLRLSGNRSDIAAMNPDGRGRRTILATSAWETNPVPSPDGTRIAFASDRDRPGRGRLGSGFEIYTMATDGTDVVRLTRNRRADIFPDWQRLP